MDNNNVILDSINREIKGVDYFCQDGDKILLEEMINRINDYCDTKFRFLAEIDAFNIPSSGRIMVQYIDQFQSESIRSYLIPQIVSDRVNECASIVLSSYLHFKNSEEYISAPGKPAPAQIYTRYDNAFRNLKPKKLKKDLLSLAYNPRDAFYLPFTMRMLASWHIPDLKNILISYVDSKSITHESVGLPEQSEKYFPPLSFIRRELRFMAIDALKYYPSSSTLELIKSYINDPDKDTCYAAKKTLGVLEKHSML